jgi:predicted ATPase
MTSTSAGHGRVVELVGEAGIGKSRLLNELVSQTDAPVLWLDGDIYATGTPYQPFHQLFAQRLGLRPGDARGAERRVRAVVSSLTPHLEPLLPLVCVVAGVDVATTPEVEAMEPEVRKVALEATTSEVLGALFADPTLLVFNDVQFMDEATTDLLDRLTTDAPSRPWLIVATRLPTAEWQLSSAAHTTSLELEPLAPGAADDLLALAIGDRHVPAHRMAALVERADGNPLFLTEMAAGIDSLLEGEAIPDTIEAIIASRIDRLTPAHKYLLRAASVLGMNLDPGMLDSVMARLDGVPPGDAHIDELGEFLERNDDGTYSFFHHVVRETAYEGLPFRRRVHVHATTAHMVARTHDGELGPAVLLSLHCFHGQLYADAYEHSKRAGADARELYANTEAAECYQRALASARQLSQRDEADIAAVCESLGEIYESLGDLDAMEDSLRQARARLRSDPQAQGRLALKTAVHRRLSGHYSDSLRWVTRGRKALAGLDDPESRKLRAQLAERYSQNLFVQGRFSSAIRWADTAIEEAQLGDDPQTQARALETRSLADSFSGRPVDLDLAARSLTLYASINDLKGLARGHNVMGLLSFSNDEWIVALQHYTESAEAYRRVGRQLDIALMQANAAEILIFQGELDRAESMLADSMRVWRGTHALGERAFGYSQQGRIAMARADYTEAARLFTEARALHVEVGETYEALTVESLQAECSYLAGDAQGALDHVEQVLGRNAEVGLHLKQFKRIEGLALLTVGQREAGESSLRESLAAARASAASYDEGLVLLALAHWGCASSRELAALERLRIRLRRHLGIVLPAA